MRMPKLCHPRGPVLDCTVRDQEHQTFESAPDPREIRVAVLPPRTPNLESLFDQVGVSHRGQANARPRMVPNLHGPGAGRRPMGELLHLEDVARLLGVQPLSALHDLLRRRDVQYRGPRRGGGVYTLADVERLRRQLDQEAAIPLQESDWLLVDEFLIPRNVPVNPVFTWKALGVRFRNVAGGTFVLREEVCLWDLYRLAGAGPSGSHITTYTRRIWDIEKAIKREEATV